MTVLAGPEVVQPAPPAGRAARPDLVLGAITVAVAVAAITPLAATVAGIPPLLILFGEATGRRPVTLAGIVVSTLFVAETPLGVRETLLVAAAAAAGLLVRLAVTGLRVPVHRAVPPLALLLVVLLDLVFRPAVTAAGQYAVFEQIIILTTLVAVLVGGYRDPGNPWRSEATLHLALVTTALVAGADSIRTMSAADPADVAGRQVMSVFGASNYVAALLAAAIIACVYRATTGRRRAWLDVPAAAVLVGMLLAQASRTSSIIVVLVVGWLLFRHGRWGWLFVGGGAAVAALVVLAPPITVLERLRPETLEGDGGLNGRVELWQYALATMGRDPAFGTGAGRLSDALQAEQFTVTYVHNSWLSVGAQFGLLGLAILVVGTWWVLTAPLGDYARAVAVTILLVSVVEPTVETLKMGLVFAAVVGLGVAHLTAGEEHGSEETA